MAVSDICLWCPKVVGVKDDRMGEEICACIRLKKGEKTTAEEIKAFCKGKVGASARPKLLSIWSSTPSPCQPARCPLPLPPHPASRFISLCRSPTSRFPDTSCLSQTIPSPSRER